MTVKSASADDMLKQLKNPFDPRFVKVRVGATNKAKTKGIALFYIDSREVRKRLDEVCGMDGWSSKMISSAEGVLTALSVRMPDGNWVTKTDGGEYTKVASFKGGCSDSLKRAAAQFGVGSYLYYIPNQWYPINEFKQFVDPPQLPNWALPQKDLVDWEQTALKEYDPEKDYNPDEGEMPIQREAEEIVEKSNSRKDQVIAAALERAKQFRK